MIELEAPIKCWEEGCIDLDVTLLPDKDLDILLTCVVQGVMQRSYLMAHLGSTSSPSIRWTYRQGHTSFSPEPRTAESNISTA